MALLLFVQRREPVNGSGTGGNANRAAVARDYFPAGFSGRPPSFRAGWCLSN